MYATSRDQFVLLKKVACASKQQLADWLVSRFLTMITGHVWLRFCHDLGLEPLCCLVYTSFFSTATSGGV